MSSQFYTRIARYYLEGYGMPKRYYSEEELTRLCEKGALTQEEMQALRLEKQKRAGGGEHGG